MTRSRIALGRNVEDASRKLAEALQALPANQVGQLAPPVTNELEELLPAGVSAHDRVSGLRLVMQTSPTLPHAGWLFSRYIETCRRLATDPRTRVAIYHDGLFEELEQFSAQTDPSLFVGFGEQGAELLAAILAAEAAFDPDQFDSDGFPT